MKYFAFALHLLLLLIIGVDCEVIVNHIDEAEFYRLLDNIVVDNYRVHIKLHDDFATFSGRLMVRFTTVYQTDTFKLNYHKLRDLDDIDNYSIGEYSATGVLIKTHRLRFINLDAKRQTVTLVVKSYVPANRNVTLTIEKFGGTLATNMHGFYKSTYGDENRVLATTQFEPTYARHAFPCFDEPSFKAKFDFSITFPNLRGYTCLFNTRKINETSDRDYKTYTFATTPIMPTYLIAFVISDFINVTDYLRQKPFSIWTTKDTLSNANFPVTESMRILAALEQFTNIGFLLNKMDEVPIPDFEPGAMENWGLVTYRREYLLYNKSESSTKHMKDIGDTIAHEFAHQWFGNLVTCDWWSNLWLNEGFASYMGPIIINKLHPEYQTESLFILTDRQAALLVDASDNYEPLSSQTDRIYTEGQINSKFDAITYGKGGQIIRMLEKFVGIDRLRTALRHYLIENQYKNANPSILLSYFPSKAPNGAAQFPESVAEIMHNWIYETGFPVLNVSRNGNDVVVTQQKFFLVQSQYASSPSTEWYVPISYTSLKRGDYETTYAKEWLIPGQSLTIANALDYYNNGLVFNVQSSGFYITNYDADLLAAIANVLKTNHESIDANARSQIIFDAMTLARARMLSYRVAFELVEYVKNDRSYFPWSTVFAAHEYLLSMLGEKSEIGLRILNHVAELIKQIARTVQYGVVDADLIKSKMQILMTHWACKLYVPDCLIVAVELFEDYMQGYTFRIPRDLRKTVFQVAVNFNKMYWYALNDDMKKSQDADERMDFIYGLAATTDNNQLLYFLDQTLQSNYFTDEEINAVYSRVVKTPEGVDATLEFLVGRWQDMIKAQLSVEAVLLYMVNSFITTEQIGMLEILLQNRRIVSETAANYIWYKIGQNQKWRSEVTLEIENYFLLQQILLQLPL